MARERRTLAFDLGGTWTRAGVVEDGVVLDRRRVPTSAGVGFLDVARYLADELEQYEPTRVVVGAAGIVDYQEGRLLCSRNLPPSWIPDLTEESLRAVTDRPIALANDADVAALGEATYGAGKGFDNILYLTISTGIGAGAVHRSRPCRGMQSLLNVGNLPLASPTSTDGAGHGARTVEEAASGAALTRRAQASGIAGGVPALVERVRAGDPSATLIRTSASNPVAFATAELSHDFLPEVVVIGGGLSQAGKTLLAPIRRRLAERGLSHMFEVRRSACGDDAGLVGSDRWVR